MVYSEYERRLVARTEYTDYDVDATVTIGKQETYKEIGTVREVVTDDFGQKAYVIQSVDKKLTIGTKVLSEKLANFIESN